jgi:hypothetical protein
MWMETVSGLDKTNSGNIALVYRSVVRNLSTVHGPIPRFWVLESSTCLKKSYKVVSEQHNTRNRGGRRLSHCVGYRQISHSRSVSLNQIFFLG